MYGLVTLFLGLFMVPAHATECGIFSTYKDVLACVVTNHYEVVAATMAIEQDKNLEAYAGQRPNIELNSRGLVGNDSYRYGELNLIHTVELGGKRSARIGRAKAQLKNTEINSLMTKERVYTLTLVALVRIRQIRDEFAVLDDALSTFSRIVRQYKSRPHLNPEQNAFLQILEIASNDYALQKLPLEEEFEKNSRYLQLAVGIDISKRPDLLPPYRKEWPDVQNTNTSAHLQGLDIAKVTSELTLANANLEEAQSLSWPDLNVGPAFQTQRQFGETFNIYGLNLTFQLPIFHANGAGRAYALAGKNVAEQILESAKRKKQIELDIERSHYAHIVEALKKSMTAKDIQQRHHSVEKSFSSGVVPSSLIIEIHRQMFDFTKNLGDQEVAALEALATVYSIEGRLLTEGL